MMPEDPASGASMREVDSASRSRPLPGGEKDPLLRFAQLNDAHLSHDDRMTYTRARERLAGVIDAIRSGSSGARPDLVLSVGDIANGDAPERLLPDNLAAAAELRRIGIPVLVTPGNHEVLQGEGDPGCERAYAEVFGADLATYAVFFRGVLFVMIHNAGGLAGGDAVSDRRNVRVMDLLDRHPDVPKIVACHIPLVPFREPRILAESFGFTTWKLLGEGGLLPILERHGESIIAVLNGHLHLTGHVTVNGIHHISVSGPASYPCHYAEYALFPDRLEVTMKQPPAHLFALNEGNIHNRTGIDFTDRDHPAHEEYVAGRADERRFAIPLSGKRRPKPEPSLLALKANVWPAPDCKTVPLTPTCSRVENLGTKERVACVPFQEIGPGPATATSPDGRRLYLPPSGDTTWSATQLAGGVPVAVPAGGAVAVCAAAAPPGMEAERISTAPLLIREQEEALAAGDP